MKEHTLIIWSAIWFFPILLKNETKRIEVRAESRGQRKII